MDRPYGERKAGGSVRVRTVEEVGRSSRCCKVCGLAGRTLVDEHFPEMCCQIFTSSDFAAMPCDLSPADFKQTDSPPRVVFSAVGAPKVVLWGCVLSVVSSGLSDRGDRHFESWNLHRKLGALPGWWIRRKPPKPLFVHPGKVLFLSKHHRRTHDLVQ